MRVPVPTMRVETPNEAKHRPTHRRIGLLLSYLLAVLGLVACTVPTFEYSGAPLSLAAEKSAVFDSIATYAREERRQPRGLFSDPRFEILSENADRGVISFAARPNATLTHNVDVTVTQVGPSVVQVEMVSFLTTTGPNIPIRDDGVGQRFITRLQEHLRKEFPAL